MSIKDYGTDDKELELETWPAFVDILSSTVVSLAFAFFVLVIMLSISKVTSATDSEGQKNKKSGGAVETQNAVLAQMAATYPKVSIVSTSVRAQNRESKSLSSESKDQKIILVPENAKVSPKPVKVTEPGESYKQVLGEIPKFTDSRVIEVLKEMVIVQQDVITQQRKVIEQQDTKIEQTTREYQSLLSIITKSPEVEDLRQKIVPKPDRAKFNIVDINGERTSGVSPVPKGNGVYILSPPNVAFRGISVLDSGDGRHGTLVMFKDNANYILDKSLPGLKKKLRANIDLYKANGVTITAKPSSYSISASEGRRVAVDRMILIRSILLDLGVNKNAIKFKSFVSQATSKDTKDKVEQGNYGWVEIVPGN